MMLMESQQVLKKTELDAQDALLYLPGLLEECDKTKAEAEERADEGVV